MKAKRNLLFVAVLGLLVLYRSALGLEALEPGYIVEQYVRFPGQYIHDIVSDGAGIMYLTLSEEDMIACMNPDKTFTFLSDDILWPTQAVWTGGTDYGDYLYASSHIGWTEGVIRVTPEGTALPFAAVRGADGLGLDRIGRYGGNLFVGRNINDRIDRVLVDGTVQPFSNFPYNMSGCVEAIEFDPGDRYGGLMYVATSSYRGVDCQWSGLHSLDTDGNPTRFASDILAAYDLAFDTNELFGGDLFVLGMPSFDQWDTLWRVTPDGIATEFARPKITGPHVLALEFGPDGAMYVSEASQTYEVITIYRVVPEPASILPLGLSSVMSKKKR